MHRLAHAALLPVLLVGCYDDATSPEPTLTPGVYEFVDTPPFAGTLTVTEAVQGEPLGVGFDATNLESAPLSSAWNVSTWRVEVRTTLDQNPSLILRLRPTAVRADFCQSALLQGEGIDCTIRRR